MFYFQSFTKKTMHSYACMELNIPIFIEHCMFDSTCARFYATYEYKDNLAGIISSRIQLIYDKLN
jgi:hypothetical protein